MTLPRSQHPLSPSVQEIAKGEDTTSIKESMKKLRREMNEERDTREKNHSSGGPRMIDRVILGGPCGGDMRGKYPQRNLRQLGTAHY